MFEFIKKLFKKEQPEEKAQNDIELATTDNLKDNYLFDFHSSQYNVPNQNIAVNLNTGSTGTNTISGFFIDGVTGTVNAPLGSSKTSGQKIKIKPIDVLNELETMPTPFTLLNLDEKLQVLKDKEALIQQKYAKREITALIERLTARKLYPEHSGFFNAFPNTTSEKIDALLSKYELVMKTSDIFVPEFPDVAISTMKSYSEHVKQITGKDPIFYVIAEEQHFKKQWKRRDPILLAQSPFGFYWQILGAWDKEMLILSEL